MKNLTRIDKMHWEYKHYIIVKLNSKWFRVTDLNNDDSDENSFEYPESSIIKMCECIDK